MSRRAKPSGWAARSEDLALWTWSRLVNRADVWGTYLPLGRRAHGGSWTAPAKQRRGAELLTRDILGRHCCGAAE